MLRALTYYGSFPDTLAQVERLLSQIDKDADDGVIAYDEWLAAMLTWRTVREAKMLGATCAACTRGQLTRAPSRRQDLAHANVGWSIPGRVTSLLRATEAAPRATACRPCGLHCLQIEKCREWDEWIEKAFAAMDSDGNGRLRRDELERFLCRDDICLSEQALHAALDEAHRACGDDMSLEVGFGGPR